MRPNCAVTLQHGQHVAYVVRAVLASQFQRAFAVERAGDMGQRVQARQRGFVQLGHVDLDLLARADHGLELGVRARGQRLAVVHDHDARADLLDFLHVVARVHHGGALAVHILDAFEDGVAALRVHGHGRLVEEDELGLVRDAACDVQATQQAAREFPRAELLVVLQADERDGLVNKVAALRAVVHIQRAEVVDVLAHGQLLEHGHVLRHDADPALQIVAGRAHGLAEQLDSALVVGQQLQDAVDGGGLARPVRS